MKKCLLLMFVLLFLVSGISMAQESIKEETLTEEQKMEEVRGYFESEYQEEDFFRTDRLLLTATKRNMPIRKAPAIATVISQDEIRYMGARNLEDVLKTVPGIGVSINEFGMFMYEVRGIRTTVPANILLMIDGHSLNKDMTGSALYNVVQEFPVENIKQVEIIRGPGSALYGANAFVAVINIITRNAVDIGGIELSVGGGSFDTGKINLVGGKIFENGFQVSGSLDYFRTNGENFYIDRDAHFGAPWTTAPGDAFTEVEKTDIFFKASYKDLAFKAHYIDKQREGLYIGMAHVLTDDSTDPIINFWSEVSYSPKVTDSLQATFKAYIDHYEQESLIEIYPEEFDFGVWPNGMIGGPWLKNQAIGAELQLDYYVSASNHLVVGTMYERMEQYDVKNISNFLDPTSPPQDISAITNWQQEKDRDIWALYVQDEWEIRENLNLTAGVRYDHDSDFGGTTNPRVGLVWGFLENADIKLLYGQAFRAPSFTELYVISPIVNGNPDLEPETIQTYEVGTTVRLKNFFTLDLNYFYSDIEDLIDWGPSLVSGAEYINAMDAEVDGLEVIVSGNYSYDNYWKLTYTYQDPKDADGARLPFVPKHRATAGINYGLTEYLKVHADVLWTGERPRDFGDSRSDMDSYTVLDLTLTADNFYKGLEIQLAVHNVLDEDYTDPDTSRDISGPLEWIPNDFPREGRSFWGEVRYIF